jgi:alkyl hydroperoxide reductase subunit AhpC
MSLVTRKAPDFSIDAVVGDGDFKKISLGDYKGKYVVLFFYPADFTFICPTEIPGVLPPLRGVPRGQLRGLGVSTDSKHSHKAWIKTGLGKLNHPLLADFNKTISSDYEALIEGGIACRATIIIDPNGDRSARVVQRRSARALGQRDAASRSGAADRRALPGRVEARSEDARQAGVDPL